MKPLDENKVITIGQSIYGNDIRLDFNEIPSLLIAGEDPNNNQDILAKLYKRIDAANNVNNFIIIDLHGELRKIINFNKNVKHIWEMDEAILFLKQYLNELNYKNDISVNTFIIIDDLPNIMLKGKKELEIALINILNHCCNSKLRLITISHYNKHDVITPFLSTKINNKIVFKVSNPLDSERLIGDKSASNIKNPREFIACFGPNKIRAYLNI